MHASNKQIWHDLDCITHIRYSKRLEAEVTGSPEGAFARLSSLPSEYKSAREKEQSKVQLQCQNDSQPQQLSHRQDEDDLCCPLHVQVQKYVMGADNQCAMTVLPAATAYGNHIMRVLPYVQRDADILICFFGWLKNSHDIEDKLESLDLGDHGDDVGSVTTGLLTALYKQTGDKKKEELMLSEIQVCILVLVP